MSEELPNKQRVAKMGIARMGRSRMGLIPVPRDRAPQGIIGSALFYGHTAVVLDEDGLAFTEVE